MPGAATTTPSRSKVGSAWANCGDWDDAPPGTSNKEVEEYVAKLEAEHDTVLVIALPTSNVFSMAFDVLARDA
jgi:hypothetical protein